MRSQYFLLCTVLLLGFLLRFANLERRVFWVDEVATAIRVSGHTIESITQDLIAQSTITAEDLRAYQFANSNLLSTWQALTSSPEHAPLFFLLARLWLNLGENSLIMMRALAVAISLLVFPAFYWLLQELFASSLISSLGIMLMSVSPFFVVYAQEARPYSLWTVSILLVSASYLRAISQDRQRSWLVYTLTLVVAFYTSLLSFLVVVGQGLFLCLSKYQNRLAILQKYLLSNLVALVLFAPWIYVMLIGMKDLETNTAWMRSSLDFSALVATWIATILLIFGDLPLSADGDAIQMAIAVSLIMGCLGLGFALKRFWPLLTLSQQKTMRWLTLGVVCLTVISLLKAQNSLAIDLTTLVGIIIAIFILALSSYGLYYCTQTTGRNQWLFIWCLLLAVPLTLLISDLLFQGQSSGTPRYFIPTQLAIQIAVAYTLGSKLAKNQNYQRKPVIGIRLIIVAVIALGIFSCFRNLNISPIYVKSRNIHNSAIAKIINQQPQTLVLLEPQTVGDILSLAHDLNPETKVKVISDRNKQKTCYKESTCYLLKPSNQLKVALENNPAHQLKPIYQPRLFTSEQIALDLWQITPGE